ncbi:hypothetical protein BpHYR1_051548 [Brachionus plicatilis]|uniref:Uncharacterized protein n=1 Tax=Brachionus plicatilis TaxID=10195 RepID=A0A3M7Q1K2_BRAPC|nr:hypothetical protein BpHYR1_051548 [Brachionus plicatilis]
MSRTASTTTLVKCSASSGVTLVCRELRATWVSTSLSTLQGTFTRSKTSRAFCLAMSKPSTMILGCKPSDM